MYLNLLTRKNTTAITIKEVDYAILGNLQRGARLTLNDSSYKIEKIEKSIGTIKLELQRYGAETPY